MYYVRKKVENVVSLKHSAFTELSKYSLKHLAFIFSFEWVSDIFFVRFLYESKLLPFISHSDLGLEKV